MNIPLRYIDQLRPRFTRAPKTATVAYWHVLRNTEFVSNTRFLRFPWEEKTVDFDYVCWLCWDDSQSMGVGNCPCVHGDVWTDCISNSDIHQWTTQSFLFTNAAPFKSRNQNHADFPPPSTGLLSNSWSSLPWLSGFFNNRSINTPRSTLGSGWKTYMVTVTKRFLLVYESYEWMKYDLTLILTLVVCI